MFFIIVRVKVRERVKKVEVGEVMDIDDKVEESGKVKDVVFILKKFKLFELFFFKIFNMFCVIFL